jgi:hypothetical protein
LFEGTNTLTKVKNHETCLVRKNWKCTLIVGQRDLWTQTYALISHLVLKSFRMLSLKNYHYKRHAWEEHLSQQWVWQRTMNVMFRWWAFIFSHYMVHQRWSFLIFFGGHFRNCFIIVFQILLSAQTLFVQNLARDRERGGEFGF